MNIFVLIRYSAMFISVACVVLGLIQLQSIEGINSNIFFTFLIIGPLINLKSSFSLSTPTIIGYAVMVASAFEINYAVFAAETTVNLMLLWLAYLFGFFISDFS